MNRIFNERKVELDSFYQDIADEVNIKHFEGRSVITIDMVKKVVDFKFKKIKQLQDMEYKNRIHFRHFGNLTFNQAKKDLRVTQKENRELIKELLNPKELK